MFWRLNTTATTVDDLELSIYYYLVPCYVGKWNVIFLLIHILLPLPKGFGNLDFHAHLFLKSIIVMGQALQIWGWDELESWMLSFIVKPKSLLALWFLKHRWSCCTLTFRILHFDVLRFWNVKFFWLVFSAN